MTITAVILNFNHNYEIHRSVEAAINQSIPFDEILIIDDASTDQSTKTINKLTKFEKNVTIIKHKQNKGVTLSVKESVFKAKSEYIYLMSAQNHYSAKIVETFHRKIKETPNAVMISACVATENSDGSLLEHKLPFPSHQKSICPKDIELMYSKRLFTFFGGGNIVHRKTVLKFNFFHENMKWHADWYMYHLLGLVGPVAISNMVFSTHSFQEKRYSDEMFQPQSQWRVTRYFISTTKTQHPRAYQIFKTNAILPFYNFFTAVQLFKDKSTRDYLCTKLIVLCLIFWPARNLASKMPHKFKVAMRGFLRL